MYEFLVKRNSISLGSVDIKISDKYVYFSGVDGVLMSVLVDYYYPNAVVAVNNKQQTMYVHCDNEKTIPAGLIVFGKGVDIVIHETSQVIIINESMWGGLGAHGYPLGVINNPYESLMIPVFDLIDNNDNATNEILAISNLMAVIAKAGFNEPLLIKIIKNNYLDSAFDLNVLCNLACMSRRAVQYALSEMGTSFSDELKQLRVMKLKSLTKSRGTKLLISSLAYKSGFKNPSAANRDFYSVTNLTIKEYINEHLNGKK